ncbi:hypothetical protein ACJX0J_025678, partial [Zea mays]
MHQFYVRRFLLEKHHITAYLNDYSNIAILVKKRAKRYRKQLQSWILMNIINLIYVICGQNFPQFIVLGLLNYYCQKRNLSACLLESLLSLDTYHMHLSVFSIYTIHV